MQGSIYFFKGWGGGFQGIIFFTGGGGLFSVIFIKYLNLTNLIFKGEGLNYVRMQVIYVNMQLISVDM